MSLNASSEEPATSTPSKSTSSKDEVNPDTAISYRTIPHGLTYKHETRHHSSYRRHSTSPKRTSSTVELKRHPLTCVKDTNYKKLDIVGAKHDLTSILTTVDKNKNKENGKNDKRDQGVGSDAESDASMHISTGDLTEDGSPRSIFPVPSLANSQGPDDIESSPVNSHQDRVVKKKQSIKMSRKRNAISVSVSDSKRQHFGDCNADEEGSKLPLIEYHRRNSTSSYRTPVRHDFDSGNSTKKAPSRTHRSRVIDESKIHQDGDTNPALDPDNSPLANVSQGSIVDQKIEGETEVFDQLKKATKSNIHELDAGGAKESDLREADSDTDGQMSDDSDDSNLRMSPVRFNSKALSPLSKVSVNVDSTEQDSVLLALDEKERKLEKERQLEDAASAKDEEVRQSGNVKGAKRPIFTSDQVQEIRNSFESVVSGLQESLKQKSKRCSLLEKNLSGLKLEVVDAKSKMEQAESEKTQLEATVKTLRVESSSATEYAANSDRRCSVADHKFRICESRLARYKELYVELMGAAKNLKKEVSKEKKTVSQLKQKLTEMKQKFERDQAGKSELQSSLELKNAEVKSLLEEKSENEVMIRNLKRINDESDSELKKLKARLNATKEKLEDLRKRNDSISTQMADSAKQIKEKAAKLEQMKKERDSALANLTSLKTRMQNVETSNSKLLLEKKAADSKISKAQRELDELDKKYLEMKKTRNEELQKKLANGQQNVEKLNEKIKALEEEKSSLEKAVKAEQAAQSKEIQAGIQENKKLNEQNGTLKNRIETLEKEITSAKAKIANNDKEMEIQMEKLAQDLYLQYSAKHEQKVATLKKGYEMKWMGKVKKFTRDNDALKREIASLKKRLEVETNEKKQLVKLWDEYVSLEKKGPKMKS